VRESGCLTTPIGLTNTHSVGIVRAADTMVGRDGITAHALTAERLLDAIERVKRG
jgi:L-aminopeptidase/D-esterase-like protein